MLRTAVIAIATIFIGLSKAGFGGGTGLVATPLLAMVMTAREAIGLMLPLLVMTDILSMLYYWRRWDTTNVIALIPGAIVGIMLGGTVLNDMPEIWLKRTIGVIALIFVLVQTWRNLRSQGKDDKDGPMEIGHRYLKGFAAGVGAGVSSTLAHIGGVVVSMYLLPQRLSNRTYVGTTTAVFFIINATKVPVYLKLNILNGRIFSDDLLLLPLLGMGVLSGILLNRRVSKRTFSYIILALVLISGTKLLIRG
ncbi:TPA: sulfite exporter TauE/SafE family protein [Candidatus Poribacteria bacterium]|nr:sulfite exporter TauE/SafE family protein [Candidatus Poribacteria bacterium]